MLVILALVRLRQKDHKVEGTLKLHNDFLIGLSNIRLWGMWGAGEAITEQSERCMKIVPACLMGDTGRKSTKTRDF